MKTIYLSKYTLKEKSLICDLILRLMKEDGYEDFVDDSGDWNHQDSDYFLANYGSWLDINFC
jgi:hypothetical protein